MNLTNETKLIGRIVDENIKVQQLKDNSSTVVAYFKLAHNKSFFNSKTNKWDEKTTFFPLKAFGKFAEYISKNFNKGDLVAVSCELDITSYKKDEQWTTYWSLVVQNIKKLAKSKLEISKTQEIALDSIDKSNQNSLDDKLSEELNNDNPWELDF